MAKLGWQAKLKDQFLKTLPSHMEALRITYKTREDHSEPISVESYSIVIHKADSSILYIWNSRNIFKANSIELLRALQPGEKMTFANIKVVFGESHEIIVKPNEFTIE